MRRNVRRTASSATPTPRRPAGRGRPDRAVTDRAVIDRAVIDRVVIDALEPRRLMSLTVELRASDGSDSATVSAVGQTVTMNVLGVVTGANGDPSQDTIDDVIGSFLSQGVGASPVAGNLTSAVAPAYANVPGSANGTPADLNGDGNLDVGSSSASDVAGYFFTRTGGSATGASTNGSLVVTLGTVTYTVTSLNGGGEANVNFRPWAANSPNNPGVWVEDGSGVNQDTSSFQAGTPFHILTGSSSGTTGTITATAYADANGNGARDAGEAPLANVSVYADVHATGSYATGDPLGITDATGTATITGVPAGTYTVRTLAPAGRTITQPSAAAGNGYAAAVTANHTTAVAGPFGFEADGSIAGTAYTDANGNGTYDAGTDAALAGATVYIDANHNGTQDAGEAATRTGSDGSYLFSDVVPGTYVLRQVVASGMTQTQPAGTGGESVTVAPGQAVTTANFGVETTPGTVTGTVFNDTNGDGAQGAGEAGVAGVRVYVDTGNTGSYVAADPSVLTSSNGTYTLPNLAPGTVTVRDVVPAGDTQTTPAGGSYSVTVASGATAAGKNFGFRTTPTPTPTPTGTVSGLVYTDADASDSYTAGDALLAGQVVYVDVGGTGTDTAGDPSATTDANGAYTITGVTPGTYPVRVVTAAGATLAEPAAGSYSVTFTAGGTVTAQNFGFTAGSPTPTPTTGTVTGTVDLSTGGTPLAGQTVYVDVNGDGTLDAGDPSATTDATGAYTITGVPAGSYSVRLVTATGASVTTPAAGSYPVTVTAGGTTAAQDFAVTAGTAAPVTTETITGTVYNDVNGDGVRADADPGLAGVTVYVDANANGTLDAGETSVTTDSTGTYTFSNVPVTSTGQVQVVVPAGQKQTTAAGGDYVLVDNSGTATTAATVYTAPIGLQATPLPAGPLTVAIVPAKSPTTVVGGSKGTVRVKVTNTSGATYTGPLTVDVYTPADVVTTAAVTQAQSAAAYPSLGTGRVKKLTLKAGKSTYVTVRYVYSQTVPTGSYRVTASATTASTAAAAAAAAATPVTIQAPAIDLTTSFVAPAKGVRVRAGRAAVATVRVTNNGTVTATGPYTVYLYYSDDATFDPETTTTVQPVNTVTHTTSVRAGKSAVFRIPFTAPAALTPGGYKLYAIATATTVPAATIGATAYGSVATTA